MSRPKVERIDVVCAHCKVVFKERPSRSRAYCSRACSGAATAKLYESKRQHLKCAHCGVSFQAAPHRTNAEFCSHHCKNTEVSRRTAGIRSEKLRGRGTAEDGGLLPTTYPKWHGRHKHRVVAEVTIGRPLIKGEIVHHDDENRHNAEPNNLVVVPSQKDHMKLHRKNRLCSMPSCGRKHAAKGFCLKHWRQDRKKAI